MVKRIEKNKTFIKLLLYNRLTLFPFSIFLILIIYINMKQRAELAPPLILILIYFHLKETLGLGVWSKAMVSNSLLGMSV